jgi:5-methylcytosine-specific restriction protein A
VSSALRCEVCGFDFFVTYGVLGRGFAECHHLVPLSALSCRRRTLLSELAIVCSNCHRMIHRARPMISISQLRTLMVH